MATTILSPDLAWRAMPRSEPGVWRQSVEADRLWPGEAEQERQRWLAAAADPVMRLESGCTQAQCIALAARWGAIASAANRSEG